MAKTKGNQTEKQVYKINTGKVIGITKVYKGIVDKHQDQKL